MEQYYIFLVVLLFVLAASDLIVGVSNDAVNFLVSAVGSKVAPLYVIMIVASLGIFIGATFSSGMMEVARKGIFNPEQFYFAEIMIIFVSVMLTDIILLDVFNTFGLPTSTTVSIVFELLGASVVLAFIKMDVSGESIGLMGKYINATKAGEIVLGIFLSIVFAFALGALLQYLSRLIFGFHYHKRLKHFGGLWAGFALSALTYFLLIKGLNGASFVTDELIQWISSHTLIVLGSSFVFWSIVMSVFAYQGYNILRVVVLFGTFTLAMAFAGNDLVNFVGVPIAGFESFMFWIDSGLPAAEFTMEALAEPVRTPTYFLLIAGVIMVVTLWFSKKARSVTATTVDLSRQDEGIERFRPNAIARGIVGFTRRVSGIGRHLPHIAEREEIVTSTKYRDQPAFDLVRASVNLTMASILIAFGTSLKLPLSTTYVSFMVAMGTSLADKAWDRDSAVYRIAGVLNVIGGWFVTAIVAFTVSGTFAFLIFQFGLYAISVISLLAIFLFLRGVVVHRQREKDKDEMIDLLDEVREINAADILNEIKVKLSNIVGDVEAILDGTIKGLSQEDSKLLQETSIRLEALNKQDKKYRNNLISRLKHIKEDGFDASVSFLKTLAIEQDILQSTQLIFTRVYDHISNHHKPIKHEQIVLFDDLDISLQSFLQKFAYWLEYPQLPYSDIVSKAKDVDVAVDRILENQIAGIKSDSYSNRNSRLVTSIAIEIRELKDTILRAPDSLQWKQ